MARRYHIPVYTTGGTADAISRMKNMKNLPEDTFHEIVEDQDFHIRDLTIHPFSIPHDAAQPVGYRVECEDKAVGIATDLGKYNDYIVDNLQNLDALLLEANHDIRMLQVGSYPYYLKQRILGDRGHHFPMKMQESCFAGFCMVNLKAVFLGSFKQRKSTMRLLPMRPCVRGNPLEIIHIDQKIFRFRLRNGTVFQMWLYCRRDNLQ